MAARRELDFATLTPADFEELCFDLLRRVGYKDLAWRRGGADQGRDIQGTFDAVNPLLETITEVWYIQCKHYRKGVPPKPLGDAVHWANQGLAQHLLVIASSYLTPGARKVLEDARSRYAMGVHSLEGKALEALVLRFDDLVARYFYTEAERLLRDARTAWNRFGVAPSGQYFTVFIAGLNLANLPLTEIAFLWVVSRLAESTEDFGSHDEVDHVIEETRDLLTRSSTTNDPLVPLFRNLDVQRVVVSAETLGASATALFRDPSRGYGGYVLTSLGRGVLMEVLLPPVGAPLVRSFTDSSGTFWTDTIRSLVRMSDPPGQSTASD